MRQNISRLKYVQWKKMEKSAFSEKKMQNFLLQMCKKDAKISHQKCVQWRKDAWYEVESMSGVK